uniref:Uncharacterized protein n=1 Tax=Rhizophora mucronata TaxID=61149 RepID=A0A2P2IK12_RHIMU
MSSAACLIHGFGQGRRGSGQFC